jgi:acyl-coenzyme A synthetase/AMP-(fatty) acid ligase
MARLFYSNSASDSSPLFYQELYEYLSSDDSVIVNNVFYNTESLFKNIIKAICYNIDLTLFDENISDSEIVKLSIESHEFKYVQVSRKMINSLDELRDCFKNSSSEVSIFTSGTTGQPKKVTHTVANLIRNVKFDNKHHSDIWALTYSPTHMAGLQVLFQALLNENAIYDIYSKHRLDIYKTLIEYKISHISGTPTFYRLLLPFEYCFEYVKRVSLGGEKSNEDLIQKIKLIFPKAIVNNIYASTEAGTLLATKEDYFSVPKQLREHIKIINNELVIHSSLLGKMNNSSNSQVDWYFTNDIIEWVDETSGYFKFSNRKNEMINIGGYKVNPYEIEDVLSSINGVRSVIVYGKPNSVLGNILCCNIQRDISCSLNEIDFKNILKKSFVYYKIPRRIYFVEKIDITKSGKQLRAI